MKSVLAVFQIIIASLLIASILLQAKGTGLSSNLGGGGEFYHSKRGAEKVIFIATIVLAVLFIASSIASMLVG